MFDAMVIRGVYSFDPNMKDLNKQAHVFQIAWKITERGREDNFKEYTGKGMRAAHTLR
jgi:hypothetical protein